MNLRLVFVVIGLILGILAAFTVSFAGLNPAQEAGGGVISLAVAILL